MTNNPQTYARTEGLDIIEWPVQKHHIINRGMPLCWFTPVKETLPPIYNSLTHYTRSVKPKWVADKLHQQWQVEQKSIRQLADDLLARMTHYSDRALLSLKAGYPEQETETWNLQKTEAEAWQVDNRVATPVLAAIAERRGLALSDLVTRVLDKSNQYAALVGLVLGDRQAAEDNIQVLLENKPEDCFEQLVALANSWRLDWPQELV
jgi:hypothetical protein